MKIIQADMFTTIEADNGMILVDNNGYGAFKIYLSKYDLPNNYTEIPKGEYVNPYEELDKEDSKDEIIEGDVVEYFDIETLRLIFEEEINI